MTQLEQLAQAERMLAGIATAKDAVDVIAFAEAARVWAQQAKLGTSAVNHATVIKLRAERRMADAVDEGQAAGQIATSRDGGRPPKMPPKGGGITKPTLEDIGVQQQRLAEARKIRDTYTDDDLLGIRDEQERRKAEGSGNSPRWGQLAAAECRTCVTGQPRPPAPGLACRMRLRLRRFGRQMSQTLLTRL